MNERSTSQLSSQTSFHSLLYAIDHFIFFYCASYMFTRSLSLSLTRSLPPSLSLFLALVLCLSPLPPLLLTRSHSNELHTFTQTFVVFTIFSIGFYVQWNRNRSEYSIKIFYYLAFFSRFCKNVNAVFFTNNIQIFFLCSCYFIVPLLKWKTHYKRYCRIDKELKEMIAICEFEWRILSCFGNCCYTSENEH